MKGLVAFFCVLGMGILSVADCRAEVMSVASNSYVDDSIQIVKNETNQKITEATENLVPKDDPVLNTIPVGQPQGLVPDGRAVIWVD